MEYPNGDCPLRRRERKREGEGVAKTLKSCEARDGEEGGRTPNTSKGPYHVCTLYFTTGRGEGKKKRSRSLAFKKKGGVGYGGTFEREGELKGGGRCGKGGWCVRVPSTTGGGGF